MRHAATWAVFACGLACSSKGASTASPPAADDDAAASLAGASASGGQGGVSGDNSQGGSVGSGAGLGAGGQAVVSPPDAMTGGDAGVPMSDAGALSTSPWLAYNYAPASRTLVPVSVSVHGNVTGSSGSAYTGQAVRLNGAGAGFTFDFGREVAGITSVSFGSASDAAQNVSVSFSESSQYVGTDSDLSTGGTGLIDGALTAKVVASGKYVMSDSALRGGFRYLSVYLKTTGWAEIGAVSLNFTAAPTMPVPNAYPNYFYANDALLNRIWYAGAYTVQLNTIDPKQGRAWPAPTTNWNNAATVGSGATVLVDGAKRDRTVWPGDLGVAVPTAYVSTGDLVSTKNSLDTLFAGQDAATGEFPRSGPPLNGQNGHTSSDTYHLWTLIGVDNYFLFSGDKSWLDKNWAAYKNGLAFSTAKIDSSHLMQVTLTKDWGRLSQGGQNIAANAVLYRVLVSSAELATVEGDSASASSYTTLAAALKTAANSLLWDNTAGAYRDNPTSTLYPQDGNTLAIWFGLVDSATKAQTITTTLRKSWNTHGAHTPECDPARATISPFPGSMEVAARYIANDDQGALDLIRLEWGYMLNAPIGTQSTFWEGYLDDGSFGYTGSYMSAAHGWSSGPTFALTEWALGVAPDSAAGQTYHVVPHPGDLTHVEGSLQMAPAKSVLVSYDHPTCGDFTLHVDASSNTGSTGTIAVPRFGKDRVVQLNGMPIWDGSKIVSQPGVTIADQDANFIYFRGMAPAKSTFSYTQCP